MPDESRVPGVYIDEGAPNTSIVPVSMSDAVFVGAGSGDAIVDCRSEADIPTGGNGAPGELLGAALREFFRMGGRSARVLQVATSGVVPTAAELLSPATGLPRLDPSPRFGLLVMPGVSDHDVLRAAIAMAERRRAHLLIDIPDTTSTPAAITAWLDANPAITRSSHASAYTPWLRVADAAAPGGERHVPPCGAIAGGIASQDSTRGVWRPLAGVDAVLTGTIGPSVAYDDVAARALAAAGVNALRNFPGRGTVVWGARTLAGADGLTNEYRYVPVRRLADQVVCSLEQSLGWVTFEPNEEPLWSRLTLVVSNYLQQLWRDGALQGTTPREAFFVHCGRGTSMTDTDVAAGRCIIQLGIAPTRRAEFLVLTVVLSCATT